MNPSSRVCKFTELTRRPLHPTQVYSILGNLVIGSFLLRLYVVQAAQTVVIGLYFLLSGMARFVEESYRGEPQTRWLRNLSEYQWLALLSVVVGAVLTAWPAVTPCPEPQFDPASLAVALVFGLFTGAAMSVDFPRSNRRFARLSG